jgi:hypothetical protein
MIDRPDIPHGRAHQNASVLGRGKIAHASEGAALLRDAQL